MAISHNYCDHEGDTSILKMRINSCKRVRVMEQEDLMSKLPDEIIVSILSRLDTIEQQARTSLLAQRWRYLWKYSATHLKFRLVHDRRTSPTTTEYINRCGEFFRHLNQIIKALSTTTTTTTTSIDTFDLVFQSCDQQEGIYQHDVDEWFHFALQKRVKRLNLDLCFDFKQVYSLNASQVIARSSTKQFESLRCLRLGNVDVSGQVLEYILSAAPLLEELSVSEPGPSLVNFTVSGLLSPKLKHLELLGFLSLEYLYIHDINIESLRYSGYNEYLTIRDTPHLVNASLSMDFEDCRHDNRILSNLPQLEKLMLRPYIPDELSQLPPQLPKLMNLKQLGLRLGSNPFCVGLCDLLLHSCPLLSQLKIEFWFCLDNDEGDNNAVSTRLNHPHQSLKTVELVGFIGCQIDLGVATYLVENVDSLETMIIDTHHPTKRIAMDPIEQEAARTLAITHLEPRLLTSQTKLIVK